MNRSGSEAYLVASNGNVDPHLSERCQGIYISHLYGFFVEPTLNWSPNR
jgi:hypothetical protein